MHYLCNENKRRLVQEYVFVTFVKNALLQTAFSAILPTGILQIRRKSVPGNAFYLSHPIKIKPGTETVPKMGEILW